MCGTGYRVIDSRPATWNGKAYGGVHLLHKSGGYKYYAVVRGYAPYCNQVRGLDRSSGGDERMGWCS